MIHESRTIAAEGEAIELDPFAFWPDVRSRLTGFGGSEETVYPDYAFHTLYVSCGSGPILFTARFTGLQAPRGTLILRIHELPEVMGAHARQIAIAQVQLTDLIRGDGTVSIPATARAGNHYALLGFIYGDTVATAERLSIEIARRAPDPRDPNRSTDFRAAGDRVATVPQIVSEHEGTLVTPRSQLCTVRQMAEPLVDAVAEQLRLPPGIAAIDRWEAVFLARALDRYDVARSGAHGLGIGAVDCRLAAWLVQHGCSLVLTTPGEPSADRSPLPEIEVVRLDPTAIDGLNGFDFAWAARGGGVGGADRQLILGFIEDVLRALKPGGLFTLVLPIDVAPRPIGDDRGPLIRRSDIDRIALLLISRGHQVAQLCPWGEAIAVADEDERVMASAFGLIVRKAA